MSRGQLVSSAGEVLAIGPLADGDETALGDATTIVHTSSPLAYRDAMRLKDFKAVFGSNRRPVVGDGGANHELNVLLTDRDKTNGLRLSFVLRRDVLCNGERKTVPEEYSGGLVYVYSRDFNGRGQARTVVVLAESLQSDLGLLDHHVRWSRAETFSDDPEKPCTGGPAVGPRAHDTHVRAFRRIEKTHDDRPMRNFITGVPFSTFDEITPVYDTLPPGTPPPDRPYPVLFDPEVHCERYFDLPDEWHLIDDFGRVKLTTCPQRGDRFQVAMLDVGFAEVEFALGVIENDFDSHDQVDVWTSPRCSCGEVIYRGVSSYREVAERLVDAYRHVRRGQGGRIGLYREQGS